MQDEHDEKLQSLNTSAKRASSRQWFRRSVATTRRRKEESESGAKNGHRLLRRSRQDKRKLSGRQEQEEEEAAVTGIRRARTKRRRDRDGTADKGATVESPAEETRETNKWDERGVERTVEKSEETKETEEATIKMKNDVLADIPATISLTTLSVVTTHPSEQANSRSLLPPLGIIGDFLNLLNRPLRPQSRSPLSLRSLSPAWWSSLSHVYPVGFHPWSGLFLPLELRCSPTKGSFVPGNRLAPCYLFFKLFVFWLARTLFTSVIQVQKWQRGT